MFDSQGRVTLGRIAQTVNWRPAQPLGIGVRDGMLLVADDRTLAGARLAAVGVSLDTRYRLLVPFGLRQVLGLGSGVRVVVIGVPDRSAVVLARAQVVVTALLDRR